MEVKKEVTEKGRVKLTIDGRAINHHLSQELTTTGERWRGIFSPDVLDTFEFGRDDDVEEIARILQERIDMVSSWFAECRSKAGVAVAEILTAEQVVERLRDKHKLM